ncbi:MULTISPECIES: magnesium protoporphyrin IX methyltransferase [Rhodomicrobium]|uniref:magnesium protoporphyrin IX methyltransferase n=1 Tax=Rhodomicrobium TaxID=1068 RepID=UPI000B4AE1FD|nr:MULTISPECIES: magnesium protoporphyrin IX methyltransferase [Rhodomicrobium]
MPEATYQRRRDQLETYFDHTAVDAWKRLTSEAPVSGIRATVRAGRDRMRATLLKWLPEDLRGARLLDAGCGTGAFAREAAQRGAEVVAVDLSPKLVDFATDISRGKHGTGRIDFIVGDMRDPRLGRFDHIVAMDSLIHYKAGDIAAVLADFADRAERSILFTFAPRTPLLATMHAVGRLFPRTDRAPAIEPVSDIGMRTAIIRNDTLSSWKATRSERVSGGFYISQAMELRPR